MKFDSKTVRKTINKAFLKEPIERKKFEIFKESLGILLNGIEQSDEAEEREEHFKNLLPPFFKAIGFGDYKINTSSNIDLAIYTGSKTKDPLGVMMEVKRPSNKAEMISKDRLNRKALHEAVLYYLEQRLDRENDDLKHVIITNMTHWYIFDAQEFERCFYRPSSLRKAYREWTENRKVSSNTDFMYDKIASFIKESDTTISGISLPLKPVGKLLKGGEGSEYEKRLISLFKFFSPIHLLKEPFANDSNSLNKEFYRELLYILGLEETKEGSTRYIRRADEKNRQSGSIIENTIRILDAEDHLSTLKNARSSYGTDRDEQLFSVAMELGITWMNRILFLKLLEAQLFRYHRKDKRFKFLNYGTIDSLDELNKLFFQVLARKEKERSDDINEKFGHIPYLNSSLFDVSSLEHQTTRISGLDDHAEMQVYSKSVLIENRGETLNTLNYLFRFLEAYDFSAEGSEEIRDESKSLINASVLGLIFEKINGYKDGSFYTPGFITEYMARETLQKAVIDAFNNKYEWECESLSDLQNEIHRDRLPYDETNSIINGLTICDPAVGSGHFLVSCLNELIAIKSELRILCDTEMNVLRGVEVTVENDELIISWVDEGLFEYDVAHTWSGTRLASRKVARERERVQKTLFHEKRHLIENCLFGVDINPNSVKICRLRLWIELLKRAYYTNESDYLELEVLPNIDINIKQGNSLVSRFELDADLSSVFKKSEHSLEDYKEAVRTYKQTGDRSEKARLQSLIEDIKSEYSTTLYNNNPINKKLSKERGKLELMQSDDLFGDVKFTKKDIKKQEKKVKKLVKQKAEEESGAFYNQAFEWRFEFPEVLDDEGRFTGFDVVIGNPPYGSIFENDEKEYIRNNYATYKYKFDAFIYFIEKSFYLLHKEGYLCFITPMLWLSLANSEPLRKFLIKNFTLKFVRIFGENVFQDAIVNTLSLLAQKHGKKNSFKIATDEAVWYMSYNDWKNSEKLVIDYKITPKKRVVISKIENRSFFLEEVCEVIQGLTPYDSYQGQSKELIKSRAFHSDKKEDESYGKWLKGGDVDKYLIDWSGEWLRYGEWLAAPRDPKFFDGERLLIREVPGKGKKIQATYAEEKYYHGHSITPLLLNNSEIPPKCLLGIINSELISWYASLKIPNFGKDVYPKLNPSDIKALPIAKDIDKYKKDLEPLVNQILKSKKQNPEADTTELEQAIDRLVYELYGLSEEEIGVVEGGV